MNINNNNNYVSNNNNISGINKTATLQVQGTDCKGNPFAFETSDREMMQAALESESITTLYRLRNENPGLKFTIDPIILHKPLSLRTLIPGESIMVYDEDEAYIRQVVSQDVRNPENVKMLLKPLSITELYEIREKYPELKSIINSMIMEKSLDQGKFNEGDDSEFTIKQIIELEKYIIE